MLESGAVVAGYRIESVLGSGGMGTVYLAADPTLPRRVALKILSPELSNDPAFRARFIKEADLAATLEHPNIVAIHTRGQTDRHQLWIALQYIDGSDAETELKTGRMTPERAVAIVADVAKALDYAHSRGVIHRDVKPANFLLTRADDRALLADFGIARALDDSGELTATGTIVGSLAYSAPEVFADGPIDARTDIYSLGAALYQLLTGRTPFAHTPNPAATMAAHLSTPPPHITDACPRLPAALDTVIATAMAKYPAQRYRSAGDLARAAAAALHQPGAAQRLTGPPPPAAAPPGRPTPGGSGRSRRRWALIAAGTAAVVLTAATTAAVTLHHRHRPAPGPAAADTAPSAALMDTGDYATTARTLPPIRPGTAAAFEAMRLADYVVGPWALDKTLAQFPPLIHPFGSQPVAGMAVDSLKDTLPGLTADLLTSHGYVTGFFTERVGQPERNKMRLRYLGNAVHVYPDHDSAVAVATAMAAKLPMASTQFYLPDHPGTLAFAYRVDEIAYNVSFTAHGPFVIFQAANGLLDTQASDPYQELKSAVDTYLSKQVNRLDEFTPTPPDRLVAAAQQRIAESAPLFAQTLAPPDNNAPANIGLWRPAGWLLFEPDPPWAAPVLTQTGVQWVSQFLATVYQTDTADHAELLADKLATDMAETPDVHATAAGVPGFPTARCFEHGTTFQTGDDAMSWQRIRWHFKCVAAAGRHAFTTFSDAESDAKQQLSAQYRMLTGQ